MIVVKKLSYYVQNQSLFSGVDFVINKGEHIGLVGTNGSGKSTLLKIISKELRQEEGQVMTDGERIGYLPQSMNFEEGETIGDFLKANLNSIITKEILQSLELGHLSSDTKIASLSGGQQTRLMLARLMLNRPTALLLDEPTNHLDYDGLELLEDFINDFPGIVLVISHDRRFLDNTVTQIFELDKTNQVFNKYAGGYTDYAIEKARRTKSLEEERERKEKLRKKMENWIALKKQEASIYDDPRKGKQIRAMEKRLEREVLNSEALNHKKTKTIKPQIQGVADHSKLIIRAVDLCKSFGKYPLIYEANFEIRGSERVGLFGKNGSGKSTVLKMLIGEIKPDYGEIKIGNDINIGYLAQHQERLDPEATVIQEFLRTERLINLNMDPKKVLGGFLFSGNEIMKKVGSLSYGERVRLSIAKLVNQKNELLILDEPTNHLDIDSREAIEDALLDYKGSLLVVSHDRYFIEKIKPERTLYIEDGFLKEVWQ